ncbi:helix-turn-helix domain-containing protein [Stakelama tenebrarum]|uniref:AraC family transcriptional regulator n=1 Tax=Stakelama tenebrarum TaxID=2711215 RepID=A0A6G6Y7P4_9SPHN|nr:AraC family transcriptional regulator [Sphingosinithalassobacter tenebrarum]QIG80817.1 AraC family transcriptional regulator [Sphingosinithalassobacter tenebrarum]
MSAVPALFVRKNIVQADESLDREALYRIAGFSGADAAQDGAVTSWECYYALLAALAEAERPEIAFHMRTSASMGCADFGAVGMAFKSAPTLRRSFERMDRHARLYNRSSTFELVQEGAQWLWVHHRTAPDCDGMYLSNEAALGTFLSLCREASGADCAPLQLRLVHRDLGTADALRTHFGCDVQFEAGIDAIVFDAAQMERPNRIGDETIWQFFTQHLAENHPEIEGDGIDQEVMLRVADALSDGVPSLERIAADLGIGSRTLQRRLSDLGKSYQSLVEEARRKLALKLIADTRYPLTEVAFLTGFAEQSSFTRAFKRWSGKTPRDYRLGRDPAATAAPQSEDRAAL